MHNLKEVKKLKEIFKKSESHGNGNVVNFLKQEGEVKLADFLEKISYAGRKIEPERLLTIKILNDLKLQEEARAKGEFDSTSLFNKIRLQLHMPNILKAGVPLALAVLAGILIFANPFTSENYQVEELKNLGKDETMIQSLSSDLDKYFQEESKLSAVDEGLAAAGSLSAPSLPQSNSFDVNVIDQEAAQVSMNSDLTAFFEQENGINQMDSALTNF